MLIRRATEADWPAIWPIVEAVVRAGDTYTYPRDLDEVAGKALWNPPGWVVLAAVDEAGALLGTTKFGPNQLGPGSHIANASFMVAPNGRGRGVGRALGEAVIREAARAGYHAMQFNAVVAANHAAVHLWQALGFEIIGTAPEAFDHPLEGRVGLHIMYRRL